MNVDNNGKIEFVEFNSLQEFYKYLCDTPLNDSFRWKHLSSIKGDYRFTQTHSYEEAVDLFHNGWSEMSQRLSQRLKAEGKMEHVMVAKPVQSVEGFQPIVPLYLSGIPNNMINRKMQPVKQKVVTLNKSVSYSCGVSTDEIIDESIKAFRIIQKLEAQNYRVNLNIVLGVYEANDYWSDTVENGYAIKVKLKKANEKLNISKLAFPLVHPSMLRRLFLRFMEVYPGVPDEYTRGYGRPMGESLIRECFPKNEILLPQYIRKDVDSIKTLDDLEKLS
jgi:hypothetical protein|nr:MAG TPA: hypothetical protein [Caudoviricetes sp.]